MKRDYQDINMLVYFLRHYVFIISVWTQLCGLFLFISIGHQLYCREVEEFDVYVDLKGVICSFLFRNCMKDFAFIRLST